MKSTPRALEHVDCFASVFGCGDGDGGFVVGFGAVEHGAGDDHAWAEETVRGDLVAGVEDGVERAAHVADAGDSVGEEEGEDEVSAVGGGRVEVDVGVHVPEAGDEVLAFGVDDLSGLWFESRGASDAGDAVAVDDDGGVGLGCAGDGVDDGCVGDGEGLRVGAEGQGEDDEKFSEGSHRLMVSRGYHEFAAVDVCDLPGVHRVERATLQHSY